MSFLDSFKMVQIKLILLAAVIQAVSCVMIGRKGFKVKSKHWDEVVGENVEKAKAFIRKRHPDAHFLVVPEDIYRFIPTEGYVNQILLGVSTSGHVKFPAKYYGYVPDLEFAKHSVGKHYYRVIEAIRTHLPSCKIVVIKEGKKAFSCCQSFFNDEIRLDVDVNGLVLHLPVFVLKLED